MDRTPELHELLRGSLGAGPPPSSAAELPAVAPPPRCPSAFMMRAIELRKSILRTRRFAQEHLGDYVGYHRICLGASSLLDAPAWDEGAAHLLASFAAEAAELQRALPQAAEISCPPSHSPQERGAGDGAPVTAASGGGDVLQSDTRSHYHIVVQQIFEELQELSRIMGLMKMERNRYNINPLRILSPLQAGHMWASSMPGAPTARPADATSTESLDRPSYKENSAVVPMNPPSHSGIDRPTQGVQVAAAFADRYVAEVADPASVRRYQAFAEQHSELLSSERAGIKDRLPEDLVVAESVERSVEDVSALLGEFSRILQSQSEVLDEVHTHSSAATGLVRGAEEQLDLTLERSKASQRTMIIVVIGLAFLLLLLDYITP